MFYKDSAQVYRARALGRFEWLEHGFGTRRSLGIAAAGNLATLRQVHSTVCVAGGGRSGCLGEGDALVENIPGRLVGVKTADCLPILLADARLRAVAAVHAGWRGTVNGIARRAVEAMGQQFGTRPQDIHAAIGPGILECCFEVGPEVAAQFGVAAAGPVKIDLVAPNRAQLTDAGVPANQIYAAHRCTMCGVEEFHSYRRDREQSGRMLSVIGVKCD